MIRRFFLCAACSIATIASAVGQGAIAHDWIEIDGRKARSDRVIAKLKSGAGPAIQSGMDVQTFSKLQGLVVMTLDKPVATMKGTSPGAATPLPKGAPAAALKNEIKRLLATGRYEFVEPDYEVRAFASPSDSGYTTGSLWGLRNFGQNGGLVGGDIEAEAAWDITTGSASVVVAVIDSGIRYTHTDLANNMWRNPGEVAGNGRDDDGNGYVDDVFGINAITGTGNPMDDNGHGTHVAGTIGAVANGGGPAVGVAWNVRLMALKFLSAEGRGSTSDAIECINYAISKGATILNNSWGGGGFSSALSSAITAANNANVLFVAAAGNDRSNNDLFPAYPASYTHLNIISVAALDRQNALAAFSNFGATSVDIGAPGAAIFSTVQTSNSAYDVFSGTSMAAPHVSGVAALVRATNPSLTVSQLRERLLTTVRPISALSGRMAYAGMISARRALAATADGNLEVSVSTDPTPLVGGEAGVVSIAVADGTPRFNATVTGRLGGGSLITFRDSGSNGDAVSSDGIYSAVVTPPSFGTVATLTVQVSSAGTNPFNGSFDVALIQAPPNDDFANAIAIPAATSLLSASNVGSTVEISEPPHARIAPSRTVWWTWTPTFNGSATISTSGSTFDTVLAVYTGTSLGSLNEIASNDDFSGSQSQVTIQAEAGTTYRIVVGGFGQATGDVRLNVPPTGGFEGSPPVFTTQPASQTVASGQDVTLTVATASASPVAYVWYKDNAPLANGGRISGASTNTLTILDAVEADEGLYYCRASNSAGGQDSSLAYLAVDFAFVGPPNDEFIDATPIEGRSRILVGSNANATLEPGEPNHAQVSGGLSTWWSWVAENTGEVHVSTTGSTFDTTLAVYTGNSVDNLTEIASNDDRPDGTRQSLLSFNATKGRLYRIAVDGYEGSFGNIQLSLEGAGKLGKVRPKIQVTQVRKRRDGTIAVVGRTQSFVPVARVEGRIGNRWRKAFGTRVWRFEARLDLNSIRVIKFRAITVERIPSRVARAKLKRR